MIETLSNTDLERGFLSSIIQTGKFSTIRELTTKDFFTEDGSCEIYELFKEIDDKQIPFSFITVGEYVRNIKPQYVEHLKLIGTYEASADLELMAAQLSEWHNKRELYRISLNIQQQLQESSKSSYVVKKIEDTLMLLNLEIGRNAKKYIEYENQINQQPVLPKFQTGVSFIDDYLKGGLTAGQLILLMGDPEAGKTLLATQILHNVSNGFKTLFFSFEFTVRDYIENNKSRYLQWIYDFFNLSFHLFKHIPLNITLKYTIKHPKTIILHYFCHFSKPCIITYVITCYNKLFHCASISLYLPRPKAVFLPIWTYSPNLSKG